VAIVSQYAVKVHRLRTVGALELPLFDNMYRLQGDNPSSDKVVPKREILAFSARSYSLEAVV
jgi:hypothetical protein